MSAFHTVARFRISDPLLSQARAKAEREGMSLAELFRHALRNAVKEAA